jgi:hypothetical protein
MCGFRIGIAMLVMAFHSLCISHAQDVQVHAGGELFMSGDRDASANPGVRWISARSATPGFFSFTTYGKFTNASDRLHVDGYIKKYGKEDFSFTVGNGIELRTLEMSKPDQATDAYAVAWISGDPGTNHDPTPPFAGPHPVGSVRDPIQSVSKVGQWDWLVGQGGNLGPQTTGNGNGIRITVSIPDLSKFADRTELRLVGWNGSSWVDLSGRPSATGNAKNSKVTGTMVPGITAIAIGKIRTVVVASIQSMVAVPVDCKTRLQWKTTFETDSSVMVVERSLDDGSFQPILTRAANGGPRGGLYTAWVNQPEGEASYRVRIVNREGHASVSPIAFCKVACPESNGMTLFPNPVTGQVSIQVRVNTDHKGPAMLEVFTSTGRKVKSQRVDCHPGVNVFSISVTDMISGYYVVELKRTSGESLSPSKPFIKE